MTPGKQLTIPEALALPRAPSHAYYYHGTNQANLNKIAAAGLDPGCAKGDVGEVTFLTPNLATAEAYGKTVLRVPASAVPDLEPSPRASTPKHPRADHFCVRRSVPPVVIEVRQWVPLLDVVASTVSAKAGYHGTLAAGVLPVALDTCRALIQQRSAKVREGHTWGLVGGAVDSLEQPGRPSTEADYDYLTAPGHAEEKDRALRATAAREFREETGRLPAQVLDPFYVFAPPSAKFEYHDFVGTVPAEFRPAPESSAAWEASGYAWVPIPTLIRAGEKGEYKDIPIHSGLRDALQDPKAQKLLKQVMTQCQQGALK